jgi:hypothetical protein
MCQHSSHDRHSSPCVQSGREVVGGGQHPIMSVFRSAVSERSVRHITRIQQSIPQREPQVITLSYLGHRHSSQNNHFVPIEIRVDRGRSQRDSRLSLLDELSWNRIPTAVPTPGEQTHRHDRFYKKPERMGTYSHDHSLPEPCLPALPRDTRIRHRSLSEYPLMFRGVSGQGKGVQWINRVAPTCVVRRTYGRAPRRTEQPGGCAPFRCVSLLNIMATFRGLPSLGIG